MIRPSYVFLSLSHRLIISIVGPCAMITLYHQYYLFSFFDHSSYKYLPLPTLMFPLSDIFSHELRVYKPSTIVFTNLTLVLLKLSSPFGASFLGPL